MIGNVVMLGQCGGQPDPGGHTVLGVDLIVIVVLLAGVLSRKRWIRRQPGAFPGPFGS
jgi:hypothetical protein